MKKIKVVIVCLLVSVLFFSCNPNALGKDNGVDANSNKPESVIRPEPEVFPEYPFADQVHTDVVSPEYGTFTQSDNLALGAPVYVKDAKYENNNHIVLNETQVSGYNDITHNPNWVCWHLGPEIKARTSFRTETKLPENMQTVHSDYAVTGVNNKYNRGHMCPNGDHGKGTYTMVNIVPQDISVNGGTYARYENAMRDYVDNGGKEYFSVAGPSLASDGSFKGKSTGLRLYIPSFVWRATIVFDDAFGDDLARLNEGKGNPKAYAIWMPNDCNKMDLGSDWKSYIVSIDFIEEKTGLDLFPDLDDSIEAAIESQNRNSMAEQKYR